MNGFFCPFHLPSRAHVKSCPWLCRIVF
jgi:hypothetical protein